MYVGLRLAALQAQMKADFAAAEVAPVRQFVARKDDMLQLLNGKYVTAVLVAEIRTGIAHDVSRIDRRLDRIERRCEERGPLGCNFHQPHEPPPEDQGDHDLSGEGRRTPRGLPADMSTRPHRHYPAIDYPPLSSSPQAP